MQAPPTIDKLNKHAKELLNNLLHCNKSEEFIVLYKKFIIPTDVDSGIDSHTEVMNYLQRTNDEGVKVCATFDNEDTNDYRTEVHNTLTKYNEHYTRAYNLWIQRSASDSPQASAVVDNASAASPVNADFARLNLSSKDLQKAPTTPQAFLSKKIYYEATTDINVADIKEGKLTYKQVLCRASIKINRKHNIVAVPLYDATQHIISLNLATKIPSFNDDNIESWSSKLKENLVNTTILIGSTEVNTFDNIYRALNINATTANILKVLPTHVTSQQFGQHPFTTIKNFFELLNPYRLINNQLCPALIEFIKRQPRTTTVDQTFVDNFVQHFELHYNRHAALHPDTPATSIDIRQWLELAYQFATSKIINNEALSKLQKLIGKEINDILKHGTGPTRIDHILGIMLVVQTLFPGAHDTGRVKAQLPGCDTPVHFDQTAYEIYSALEKNLSNEKVLKLQQVIAKTMTNNSQYAFNYDVITVFTLVCLVRFNNLTSTELTTTEPLSTMALHQVADKFHQHVLPLLKAAADHRPNPSNDDFTATKAIAMLTTKVNNDICDVSNKISDLQSTCIHHIATQTDNNQPNLLQTSIEAEPVVVDIGEEPYARWLYPPQTNPDVIRHDYFEPLSAQHSLNDRKVHPLKSIFTHYIQAGELPPATPLSESPTTVHVGLALDNNHQPFAHLAMIPLDRRTDYQPLLLPNVIPATFDVEVKKDNNIVNVTTFGNTVFEASKQHRPIPLFKTTGKPCNTTCLKALNGYCNRDCCARNHIVLAMADLKHGPQVLYGTIGNAMVTNNMEMLNSKSLNSTEVHAGLFDIFKVNKKQKNTWKALPDNHYEHRDPSPTSRPQWAKAPRPQPKPTLRSITDNDRGDYRGYNSRDDNNAPPRNNNDRGTIHKISIHQILNKLYNEKINATFIDNNIPYIATDTGATVTVVSTPYYKKHLQHYEIQQSNDTLEVTLGNGQKEYITDSITVHALLPLQKLTHKKEASGYHYHTFQCFVLPSVDYIPMLLGQDVHRQLSAWVGVKDQSIIIKTPYGNKIINLTFTQRGLLEFPFIDAVCHTELLDKIISATNASQIESIAHIHFQQVTRNKTTCNITKPTINIIAGNNFSRQNLSQVLPTHVISTIPSMTTILSDEEETTTAASTSRCQSACSTASTAQPAVRHFHHDLQQDVEAAQLKNSKKRHLETDAAVVKVKKEAATGAATAVKAATTTTTTATQGETKLTVSNSDINKQQNNYNTNNNTYIITSDTQAEASTSRERRRANTSVQTTKAPSGRFNTPVQTTKASPRQKVKRLNGSRLNGPQNFSKIKNVHQIWVVKRQSCCINSVSVGRRNRLKKVWVVKVSGTTPSHRLSSCHASTASFVNNECLHKNIATTASVVNLECLHKNIATTALSCNNTSICKASTAKNKNFECLHKNNKFNKKTQRLHKIWIPKKLNSICKTTIDSKEIFNNSFDFINKFPQSNSCNKFIIIKSPTSSILNLQVKRLHTKYVKVHANENQLTTEASNVARPTSAAHENLPTTAACNVVRATSAHNGPQSCTTNNSTTNSISKSITKQSKISKKNSNKRNNKFYRKVMQTIEFNKFLDDINSFAEYPKLVSTTDPLYQYAPHKTTINKHYLGKHTKLDSQSIITLNQIQNSLQKQDTSLLNNLQHNPTSIMSLIINNIQPPPQDPQRALTQNDQKLNDAIQWLENNKYSQITINMTYPNPFHTTIPIQSALFYTQYLHAQATGHLRSEHFHTFLKKYFRLTHNNNDVTDKFYWLIWGTCETCAKHKNAGGDYRHPNPQIQRFLNEKILYMDLMQLEKCTRSSLNNQGKEWLLTQLFFTTNNDGDIVSIRSNLQLLQNKHSNEIIQHTHNFITADSTTLPDVVWFDQGTENTNNTMRTMLDKLNIQRYMTEVAEHKSNGIIENFNGLVRKCIHCICGEKEIKLSEVHDYIPLVSELIQQNYETSKLGDEWSIQNNPNGPRWQTLKQLSKDLQQQPPIKYRFHTGDKVWWKAPNKNKNDHNYPMIIYKHLGSHTYVVKDDMNTASIHRPPSATGEHIALEQHLKHRQPNIVHQQLDILAPQDIAIQTDPQQIVINMMSHEQQQQDPELTQDLIDFFNIQYPEATPTKITPTPQNTITKRQRKIQNKLKRQQNTKFFKQQQLLQQRQPKLKPQQLHNMIMVNAVQQIQHQFQINDFVCFRDTTLESIYNIHEALYSYGKIISLDNTQGRNTVIIHRWSEHSQIPLNNTTKTSNLHMFGPVWDYRGRREIHHIRPGPTARPVVEQYLQSAIIYVPELNINNNQLNNTQIALHRGKLQQLNLNRQQCLIGLHSYDSSGKITTYKRTSKGALIKNQDPIKLNAKSDNVEEFDITTSEPHEHFISNETTEHLWKQLQNQVLTINPNHTYTKNLHRYASSKHNNQEDLINDNTKTSDITFEISPSICNMLIQQHKLDYLPTPDALVGMNRELRLRDYPINHPIHEMSRQAKIKELQSLKDNDALKPIKRKDIDKILIKNNTTAAILRVRWVPTWKVIDGKVGIKQRLVAQGTKKQDIREGVQTEVAMPNLRALRLVMAWAMKQQSWNPETTILQGDLKTAFLQATNISPYVFIHCPKDHGCITDQELQLLNSLFSEEGIAHAIKTLYGTCDAPHSLDVAVRQSLIQQGYKESLTCPNLYRRFTSKNVTYMEFSKLNTATQQHLIKQEGLAIDSIVFVYVDDILMISGITQAKAVAQQIQQKWKFKEPPSKPTKFLGINMHMHDHGIFWEQTDLAKSLYDSIDEKYIYDDYNLPLARELTEITNKIEQQLLDPTTCLNESQQHRYCSLLGQLQYLSNTRIDLLFILQFFGRWGIQATKEALHRLQMAAAYTAQHANYGICFTRPEHKHIQGDFSRIQPSKISIENRWKPCEEKSWHFDVFPDATYNQGRDTAVSGHLILLNKMPVAYKSAKQRRQAHSSTRAELLTLYDTVDVMLSLRVLLQELGIPLTDTSINVWCDSKCVVENCRSPNPKCTEKCSEIIARQLRNIFMEHYTEDAFRLTFPRAADLLEDTNAPEHNVIFDLGSGPQDRFQQPTTLTTQLALPLLDKADKTQLMSVITRLNDGDMGIIHIDGNEQLADALTKIDVNIDYFGRILHDYKLFSQQLPTPIREIVSLIDNKKLKWKIVNPSKTKTSLNTTTVFYTNQHNNNTERTAWKPKDYLQKLKNYFQRNIIANN